MTIRHSGQIAVSVRALWAEQSLSLVYSIGHYIKHESTSFGAFTV